MSSNGIKIKKYYGAGYQSSSYNLIYGNLLDGESRELSIQELCNNANQEYESFKKIKMELFEAKKKKATEEELRKKEKNLISAMNSWANCHYKINLNFDDRYHYSREYDKHIVHAKKILFSCVFYDLAREFLKIDENINEKIKIKNNKRSIELKNENKTEVELSKNEKNNPQVNFRGANLGEIESLLRKKFGDKFESFKKEGDTSVIWKINEKINIVSLVEEIKLELMENKKIGENNLIFPEKDILQRWEKEIAQPDVDEDNVWKTEEEIMKEKNENENLQVRLTVKNSNPKNKNYRRPHEEDNSDTDSESSFSLEDFQCIKRTKSSEKMIEKNNSICQMNDQEQSDLRTDGVVDDSSDEITNKNGLALTHENHLSHEKQKSLVSIPRKRSLFNHSYDEKQPLRPKALSPLSPLSVSHSPKLMISLSPRLALAPPLSLDDCFESSVSPSSVDLRKGCSP